jgi:hypothetical protein
MKRGNSDPAELHCVEKGKVISVKKNMKTDDFFHSLAETFKAMSDPTEQKSLCPVHENELCVHELPLLSELQILRSHTSSGHCGI